MNPEEGELRPQLLDRFGLTVEVHASRDVDTRTEVIKRSARLRDRPDTLRHRMASRGTLDLATKITAARAALAKVSLPEAELRRIASVCAAFDVDGMRADLVVARAAIAHAAWRGAQAVEETDVAVAATARTAATADGGIPFDAPGISEDQLQQALDDARTDDPDRSRRTGDGGGPTRRTRRPLLRHRRARPRTAGEHSRASIRPPPLTRRSALGCLQLAGTGDGAPGRRSSRERAPGAPFERPLWTVAVSTSWATVTAAATAPAAPRGRSGPGLVVRTDDVRRAVREGRESNLVLFAVDASGSMAARRRMAAVDRRGDLAASATRTSAATRSG